MVHDGVRVVNEEVMSMTLTYRKKTEIVRIINK